MLKELKAIGRIVGTFILIIFLIFIINQFTSIYNNLQSINNILAIATVSILSIVCVGLLLAPLYMYLKLPGALPFPDSPEDNKAYHRKLRQRLLNHPHVKQNKLDPNNEEDYQKIQQGFKERSDKIINETASAIFISTAISQNGKLDAFTVLAAQVRLVWKVAHIYWQRPSFRNLWQLYTNVAVNSLAASGIEQLDLSRQIEPIIRAIMKSPARSVPFLGDAAHIITDSILEGSVNAFLTLRVGIMTRNYCFPDQVTLKDMRRNTFAEASSQLTNLVIRTSGKVIEGLYKAGKNVSVRTFKSGYDKMGQAFKRGTDSVSSIFKPKS